MKSSTAVLIAMLLVSASSYVGTHEDITSFKTLFADVQHVFGLLGVLGAVLMTWFSESPIKKGVPKKTSEGSLKTPNVVEFKKDA